MAEKLKTYTDVNAPTVGQRERRRYAVLQAAATLLSVTISKPSELAEVDVREAIMAAEEMIERVERHDREWNDRGLWDGE